MACGQVKFAVLRDLSVLERAFKNFTCKSHRGEVHEGAQCSLPYGDVPCQQHVHQPQPRMC